MMAFVSPSGKQLCFSLVHRFWTSLVHLEQQNPLSPAPLTKGKSASVKFRERSNPRFLTYYTIKKEIWGKRGFILQSLCSASPTNPNPPCNLTELERFGRKECYNIPKSRCVHLVKKTWGCDCCWLCTESEYMCLCIVDFICLILALIKQIKLTLNLICK